MLKDAPVNTGAPDTVVPVKSRDVVYDVVV